MTSPPTRTKGVRKGTLIITLHGIKPIEELEDGEIIWTYDKGINQLLPVPCYGPRVVSDNALSMQLRFKRSRFEIRCGLDQELFGVLNKRIKADDAFVGEKVRALSRHRFEYIHIISDVPHGEEMWTVDTTTGTFIVATEEPHDLDTVGLVFYC